MFVGLAGAVNAGDAKKGEPDKAMMMQMVQNSIQTFPLEDGITVDDAIDSMMLRANNLNFKLVADLPLSEQVKAMGEDARYMRILAFCDALIAKKMVDDKSYDLCLSDIRTPGMDGIQLYQYLEQEHPELARRVIFTTGDVMSD